MAQNNHNSRHFQTLAYQIFANTLRVDHQPTTIYQTMPQLSFDASASSGYITDAEWAASDPLIQSHAQLLDSIAVIRFRYSATAPKNAFAFIRAIANI